MKRVNVVAQKLVNDQILIMLIARGYLDQTIYHGDIRCYMKGEYGIQCCLPTSVYIIAIFCESLRISRYIAGTVDRLIN